MQPVFAHQRRDPGSLDDAEMRLVKDDVLVCADEPRQQIRVPVPGHRFVADEIGIGGHHDRAFAEVSLDEHRVGAARVNHAPGAVQIGENRAAVPVEGARQRQIRFVHHPRRLVNVAGSA